MADLAKLALVKTYHFPSESLGEDSDDSNNLISPLLTTGTA